MQPTRLALIVTRELLLGNLLGAVLRHREYTPVTAPSGKIALERFTADKPALTFVDLASLGQDGLDLITDIRLADPDASIVAVIGRGAAMLEAAVYNLGVTDIVRRDEDMQQMLEVINELDRGTRDGAGPARRSPGPPSLDEPTTVLVVDDDESVRKMLERVLSRSGYRVVTASDGEQAMQKLDQEKIHLLLLDLQMPRLGGLAVLRWVRERPSPPRVVIVSASTDLQVKLETIKLGAFDYLQKPVSMDRLLVTASAAMVLERARGESMWKQWARRFK